MKRYVIKSITNYRGIHSIYKKPVNLLEVISEMGIRNTLMFLFTSKTAFYVGELMPLVYIVEKNSELLETIEINYRKR